MVIRIKELSRQGGPGEMVNQITLNSPLGVKVSMYESARSRKSVCDSYNAIDIVKEIKSLTYEKVTTKLRTLAGEENREYKKSEFYGVTWSGVFAPTRASHNLIKHSGLICLDIDKLSPEQLIKAQKQVQGDTFTLISFISPNGNGIKVIVQVNMQHPEQHKAYFDQLLSYYRSTYSLVVDPSGSNVDRLCFLPYDEKIFVNQNNTIFQLYEEALVAAPTFKDINKEPQVRDTSVGDYEVFEWCFEVHNRKQQFQKGGRNHYLTALANFCNDYGVSKSFLEAECLERFCESDFTKEEILATIKSVYNKTYQHGCRAYVKNSSFQYFEDEPAGKIEDDSKNNEDVDSPIIPSFVYQELPDLLNRMCQAFISDREKDTFLTGAMVVLSGCFSEVSGLYDGVSVHANLFGFIVAPAATGKGAMGWAKTIALGYHKELSDDQYFSGQPTSQLIIKEDVERGETDTAPKILFFPANSSAPSIISALNENDERGVIFESEADTLSATLSNDWGNYSDMLRKAFHHEAISYMRKTNNEYKEIAKPQLSVCLSGTPGQVQRLIPNAEDGLFSRFIFYNFALQPKWRSVGPYAGRVNLNEFFNTIQSEVLGLIHLVNDNGKVNFTLQQEQWEHIDTTFSSWLDKVTDSIGGNAGSAVKRLGLIAFRMAMILSILRRAETGEIGEEMECTETDFMIAMALAKTYKQHSITMYKKMPQEKIVQRVNSISEKQAKYIEAQKLKQSGLSNRKIAGSLDVTEGTIRNWLKGGGDA